MTRGSRHGSILIVVLFVMTVLSLLAVSFSYATSLRSRSARDRAVGVRLRAQLRSAVEIAVARLAADEADFHHPAQGWKSHAPLADEGWMPEWAQVPQGQGSEFLIDYEVIDEGGKLHVARASDEQLLRLGMSRDQIACLRDWMDPDDIAQAGGAESDFYLSRPMPHSSKNAPIQVLDELLLLRGVNASDYYGHRAASVSQLLGADRLDLKPGWIDLLTVADDGTVNLNTAPEPVLRSLKISDGAVEQIVRFRQVGSVSGDVRDHAFRTKDDIQQLQGLTTADRRELQAIARFKSSTFRVFAYALHRPTGLSDRCEVLVKRGESGPEVLQWKQGR